MEKVSVKQVKQLVAERDSLLSLGRYLSNVENKRGFYNIALLKKMGLIKKHVTRKGKMVQGQKSGEKSDYVLTEKGKRVLSNIRRFIR